MRRQQQERGDWLRIWAGAAFLTLAVFLVLPLTQMASSRVQKLRLLTAVQTVSMETDRPPETPPPPPPPPEPEPAEPPPPMLAEAVPSLPLSLSLEAIPGGGGTWAGNPLGMWEPVQAMAAAETFRVEDLERPPEVLSAVPPVYPAALRRAGVEGRVVLLVVVDEQGRVEEARVERSSRPEFEAPALEAIRKWRFRPGMKDGQPVRTFLRQPIRFSVSS